MKYVLLLIAVLYTSFACSQGVNNYISGAKSMGLAGASSSYVKDASSSYFNPAIPVLLGNHAGTGGIGAISSKSSYLNPLFSNTQENSTIPLLIPFNVSGVYKIDDNMAASLSINTPFGIGRRWDNEWSGRYLTQEFRFKTLQIQPTFSYLIREDLTIGAGFIIARSDILYKHRLDYQNINSTFTGNDFGFGGNIGVWGKINEGTEYGVTFKTPISYKYEKGITTLENVPTLLAGSISDKENVTSAFKTPYQISMSMSNRVSEKVFITYQFDLDGWKAYKDLSFNFENEELNDVTFNKNFKNSFAFRVAGEFRFTEEIHFRGGFYYRETPIADEYFSPDLPDGSTLGYTAGATYIASENISIDLGFLYENQGKRNFHNDQHNFDGVFKTLNYATMVGLNYTL